MLNISRQAYVFTIILIISSIINLVVSGAVFGVTGFLGYILIFIIGIPFTLLSIYNLDCLTVGGCEIWSWIVSILSCISLFMVTISMIMIGMGSSKVISL